MFLLGQIDIPDSTRVSILSELGFLNYIRRLACCLSLLDQKITCAVSPLPTKILGHTSALNSSILSGLNFSNYLPKLKIFRLSQHRYYIPFLDFCVFLPTFKKSNGPDRGLVSIALSPSQNHRIFSKSYLSKFLNGNVMSRFFQNQKFVPTADALCYLRT